MSPHPLNPKIKNFKLIDYEYSYYNYNCFDLGNFLNESCFNYEVDSDPFFDLKPFEYTYGTFKLIDFRCEV